MASMRDIKRRKTSIQSTQQITKAMKLVSTVKLQRAKARAERSKTYFGAMYDTVHDIIARTGHMDNPYVSERDSNRKAVIVITSNRGLAGGYNSNIVKMVAGSGLDRKEVDIYAIGKKGRDLLKRRGFEIKVDHSEVINEPLFSDAMHIADEVLESYRAGEVGELWLAYTGFKNTVSHIPTLIKLLPVDDETVPGEGDGGSDDSSETDKKSSAGSRAGSDEPKVSLSLMNYEPEETEALELIIPKYVSSLIYGALIEAVASENGARMQAMDSATSNAEEMIGTLELQYNRARQGHITQELTEIIGGAEALSS
ncbi:MAG: ATP synthase F1 subunit gamma [Lachnospiraceae bacterium]|nr:ATP synthase F1 subunit gamma [Lachnospiraceae bacterium]